jgi:hypothetical protein
LRIEIGHEDEAIAWLLSRIGPPPPQSRL